MSEIITASLVTLMKGFIVDENISIKLSTQQLHIISVLLNDMPDFFGKIEEHLKKITSNNVMNLSDLPEFVLLLTETLNADTKSFKILKITRRDAIDVIEAIIYLLIDQNIIKSGDQRETFVTLLRLSMRMIDIKINLDKDVYCRFC